MLKPTQITAFLAVIFIILFSSGRSVQAQERTIKSKYEFGTPELDAAQKLYSGKKYEEALAAFQAIIDKAEVAANWEELIYAMEKKALALRRLERYEEVILTMDSAIDLALQRLPKEHFLVSKMYYTRGTTDHTRKDFYSARSYLDTSLVFYDNSRSYDSTAYYRILEYKYNAYKYSEGSPDTLIKYLDKLMELEEARQKKKRNANNVLKLLQGYPNIYLQKGDFEQALGQAIKGYKYAKSNQSETSNRYFAEAQYALARVLYYKKEYAKALKIGLEAMPLVESTPRDEMPEYFAFNNLLGAIYSAMGDYEMALPYYERAAQITWRDGDVFERSDETVFYSRVIMNLGICYDNLGQGEKAKEFLERALKLQKEVVDVPNPGFHSNYEHIGNYYSRRGLWKEALVSYDSALRNGLNSYVGGISEFPGGLNQTFSYQDLSTMTKKTASLNNVAKIENDGKELLLAADNYAKNLHLRLIDNRKEFLASEGKLFLSQNFKNLYETGIDACFELYSLTKDTGFFRDAMAFAKQSKAILFLEQSQEFDLVNNELLSLEMKEIFYNSKSNLENLQKQFDDLTKSSIISDSSILINDMLLEARVRSEVLKDSIESILMDFDMGQSDVQKLLLDTIETKVPEKHVLIEFFYGDDNIYVLAKSTNNVAFLKIEIGDRINRAVKGIIELVSSPPKAQILNEQFDSFVENATFLYESFMKPVLDQMNSKVDHLVIVPDEILSRIPFEALVRTETPLGKSFYDLDYLVRSLSIQYELSSEMLNRDSRARLAENQLLGIGFSQKERPVGTIQSNGSLPGTENEIKFLQAAIEGKYLLGNMGSKQRFLNLAKDYDILHLAVHGTADSLDRYKSSLIFNGASDNVLNTGDLYLAGLKSRLAVLSACESGVGVVNKGEGTFSIARGFSLVGVPSIVMSLWKVNDEATSTLMKDMYDGFIYNDKPINEALREAKIRYLEKNDEYFSHPYYWAAFLHLGENVELARGNPHWISRRAIFAFIIFLLVIGGFGYKKRKRAK